MWTIKRIMVVKPIITTISNFQGNRSVVRLWVRSEETQPSRPANPSLTLLEAPNPRVIRRPLNGFPKKAGWSAFDRSAADQGKSQLRA